MSADIFAGLGLQDDLSGLLANPVPRRVDIRSLLVADKTYQFRITTPESWLEESMGQVGILNPIKVMPQPGDGGGEGYIILDGHCRVAAAVKLGWTEIWALIYPTLSEEQARWVAYVSNTGRRNLTPADRANFVLMARQRGDDNQTIEQVTQRKIRTLQRYLEVSPELLEHFDGIVVNLSHLQSIQLVDPEVTAENLDLMIETIREDRLDSKKFKKWLQAQGWLKKSPGRKKKSLGTVGKDRVELRTATLRENGNKEGLLAACEFLAAAQARLQDWLGGDVTAANTDGSISAISQREAVEVDGPSESAKTREVDST